MSSQVNFLIAAYSSLSEQDKEAFAIEFTKISIPQTKQRAKRKKMDLPDPHYLAELILQKHREKHGYKASNNTSSNESCITKPNGVPTIGTPVSYKN